MRSNVNFFSDEKFRSIFFQTLVIGLFALGIYFIVQTTAYNLEKRNIATGWSFLQNPAGFDISFSPFLEFVNSTSRTKAPWMLSIQKFDEDIELQIARLIGSRLRNSAQKIAIYSLRSF